MRRPAFLLVLAAGLVAAGACSATRHPVPAARARLTGPASPPLGSPAPPRRDPGTPNASGAPGRYRLKNGHLLAIVAGSPDLDGIFTLRPDGSDLRRLPLPSELGPEQVAWSPDGRRLAFTATDLRRHESANLYVVNADGTGLRQLTHGKLGLGAIAWSPDGSQIAAVGGRGQIPHAMLVGVDGGRTRPILTRYWVRSLAWGPDGRFWFAAVTPPLPGGGEYTGIWTTTHPEAATAHQVARPTRVPHPCCAVTTLGPTSADGRQIVAAGYPRHDEISLISGSGRVRVLGRCLLRTCVKVRTNMMGVPFEYAAHLGQAALEPGGHRMVLLAGPGVQHAYTAMAARTLRPAPLRIPGGPSNIASVSWRTTAVAPSP